MTSESATNSRTEVQAYLRLTCESAMLGREPPQRPSSWVFVDPAGLEAAEGILTLLSHLVRGDWLAARLFASCAFALCEQAGWPELEQLSRFAELYASLKLSRTELAEHRDDFTPDTCQSETLISRLAAFSAAASLAKLDEVATSLQNELLDELASDIEIAMRERDWTSIARLRRAYLIAWHEFLPNRIPDRSQNAPRPLSEIQKIGEVVGLMHSKSIVHGTLLLESFSPDISVKNFGQTKFLDRPDYQDLLSKRVSQAVQDVSAGRPLSPESLDLAGEGSVSPTKHGIDNPHIDAFVADLESLWHQLSPRGQQAFAKGYLSVREYATAGAVLKRVQALVDSKAGAKLPFDPLCTPYYGVRAAGYALRHFAGPRPVLSLTLDEILEVEDLETRIKRLSELIVEAWHVAPETYSLAVEQLQLSIWRSIEERSEAAAKVCEETARALKPFLNIQTHRRLLACGIVARAKASKDPDESALYFSSAASEFIALNDHSMATYACRLMDDALSLAASPEKLGEVAVQCLAGYVEMASKYADDAFLELALAAAAQIPPFFLSKEHAEAVSAYEQYAYAVRPSTSDDAREKLFLHVSKICSTNPSLDSLESRVWSEPAPTSQEDESTDEISEPLRLSQQARQSLAQRNWPAAAGILLHDLAELEARDPASPLCLALAAQFVSALHTSSDYIPHKRGVMARDLLGVVTRYAPTILADGKRADSPERKRRLANQANTFGWAAVHFSHFLRERSEELLERGIELLEMAVEMTPKETIPQSFSSYANNLALGYRARASFVKIENRKALLEQAAELMRQVAAVDEQLSQSSDPADRAVGATAYLDHFNLGLICHDLARATYDATWISQKPKDSARWYRQAADAFVSSRKLAEAQDRPDNAGTASNSLALVCFRLCEHFLLERTWAGGDIQRAFYDWLATFAGGHVSTEGFLNQCAESALAAATSAARVGIKSNPALLLESLDSQLRLWSLFNQYPEFAPAIARHCLVTLLELFDEINESDSFKHDAQTAADLRELQAVLEALFQAELCQHMTHHAEDAQSAYEAFKLLSKESNPVARAVARPRLAWFALDQQRGGVTVNGLYLGAVADGLELRVPSQRRQLRLSGLQITQVSFAVQDAALLRGSAAIMAARMESSMTLEDLPPTLLTGTATGTLGEAEAVIQAIRLPIASWDSWALELSLSKKPSAAFKPSLPYIGKYDVSNGTMSTDFPARLERPGQSLIFGQQGMTLDVTIPFTPVSNVAPYITISGTRDEPEVHMNTSDAVLAVKTTPRIASGDVAYFVRRDRPEAAMCCAASFDLASPSVSFPKPMLHAYGPLFFFDDKIEPGVLEVVNDLNPHEIVLIGLPDEQAASDSLLLELFDPRREILILVEEGEQGKAERAIHQLRRSIASRIGGVALLRAAAFRSAAAVSQDFDPTAAIQVVVAPREWVPTATQMLLDLAAIRRSSLEDVPVSGEDGVTFVNLKGNPFIMRQSTTLSPGTASLAELIERYRSVTQESVEKRILLRSPEASQKVLRLSTQAVPRRPSFIVPTNPLTALAALPYIRHLGALPLPASTESVLLLESLKPVEVYTSESEAVEIPKGEWTLLTFPASASDLTRHYQAYVKQDYRRTLDELWRTHPHLLPSRRLLEEMQPADYVVLCASSESERPWAYLAANYAAALHAPLLLAEFKSNFVSSNLIDQRRPSLAKFVASRFKQPARHLGRTGDRSVASPVPEYLGEAYGILADINPAYLGFVSSAAELPIELMGSPPVAIRFAIGRLSGPDLASTSLLITRAALSEDTERPAAIDAILVDCGRAVPSQPLPGVTQEIEAIDGLFRDEKEIQVRVIQSASTRDDKSEFLRQLPSAHLIHFAGHGYYDATRPDLSGLQFGEGTMKPQELSAMPTSAPIIFGNACETGLVGPAASGGRERAWSGLAASFIACGAVNYLGSLSKIFDDSSSRFAQQFYELLITGETVGNALLQAKKFAYDSNDSIWKAYVMFGCPRNRLRAQFLRN